MDILHNLDEFYFWHQTFDTSHCVTRSQFLRRSQKSRTIFETLTWKHRIKCRRKGKLTRSLRQKARSKQASFKKYFPSPTLYLSIPSCLHIQILWLLWLLPTKQNQSIQTPVLHEHYLSLFKIFLKEKKKEKKEKKNRFDCEASVSGVCVNQFHKNSTILPFL